MPGTSQPVLEYLKRHMNLTCTYGEIAAETELSTMQVSNALRTLDQKIPEVRRLGGGLAIMYSPGTSAPVGFARDRRPSLPATVAAPAPGDQLVLATSNGTTTATLPVPARTRYTGGELFESVGSTKDGRTIVRDSASGTFYTLEAL